MTRGRPPRRPRARAAAKPSLTRCRIRFRSISAKAAWICRKARPAGVVVSIGELSALKAMPRHPPKNLTAQRFIGIRLLRLSRGLKRGPRWMSMGHAGAYFVHRRTRQPGPRLALLVLLKTFQRLGYFIPLGQVPTPVVEH